MTANPRPARRGLWWVLSLIIMAVIWLLSASSDTPGPPLRHPLDWIAHFLAYLALAFALGRATGRWQVAWVIAVWFGAIDEVHQAFVPGREAGIIDWFFDTAGAWVGARLGARRRGMGGGDSPGEMEQTPRS
ncbi:VanZ family protein [Deinococcus puniceus]|uniref:Antibiotic resistance protein VanZ n=1 Tax=Deinococcus puniceus TaxID=1182568 RepID=A0A172TBV5_9DEIO|nr:VanZ family protein [Deinococcus puniceus]ANE44414.1 antibiotic resistance protein VanZ [Deinococcus puniceus]